MVDCDEFCLRLGVCKCGQCFDGLIFAKFSPLRSDSNDPAQLPTSLCMKHC